MRFIDQGLSFLRSRARVVFFEQFAAAADERTLTKRNPAEWKGKIKEKNIEKRNLKKKKVEKSLTSETAGGVSTLVISTSFFCFINS